MKSHSHGSLRQPFPFFVLIVATLALANGSFAADGILEINQSCAVNTGCFVGDSAGFPVTISAPGSYALTGNLDVSSVNTTAIQVLGSGNSSTIDLNGYSITGPVTCGATGCTAEGTGRGIDVNQNTTGGATGVTIADGFIRGMGSFGVFSSAQGTQVRNVTARGNAQGGIRGSNASVFVNNVALFNGGLGISGSDHSIIERNTAQFNGVANSPSLSTTGILGSEGSTIIGNTSQDNVGIGINASRAATVINNSVVNNGTLGIQTGDGSTVIGNSVRDNTGTGLVLGLATGYANNVVTLNGGTVSGGIQIGTNVCDADTVCP